MKRTRLTVCTLLVAAALIPWSGCGIERIGTVPIGDVVGDEFAGNPLLNQITVGDAAAGFRFFAGALEGRPELAEEIIGLTFDQIARVEELQALLDTFGITEEQFAGMVRVVLGDGSPASALAGFEFFGTPFGTIVGDGRAEGLALTPEQREQIREIVLQRQSGVQSAREQTHGAILEVLTEEQLAALREAGLRDFDFTPDGYDPLPERPFFERLAEALELTDEQVTQIEAQREELQISVENVHWEARDAFLDVLTEAQREALERIEGVEKAGL